MSFDIINMFLSIDSKIGINFVKRFLDERACKDPPTQCVTEGLELCLSCNHSVFNKTYYIKTDGKVQGLRMSCLYSNIAMAGHESKVSLLKCGKYLRMMCLLFGHMTLLSYLSFQITSITLMTLEKLNLPCKLQMM